MRLFTALTSVVLLVVLAGCGADQSYSTTDSNSRPFEVIMDNEVIATCDKIRTHTHAMVQCMTNSYDTVGYFSTERVNVIRKSNGY